MKSLLYFLFPVLIVVGCTTYKTQPLSQTDQTVLPFVFDPALIKAYHLRTSALIEEFYKIRGYRLLWSDSTGVTAEADSLISLIRTSERLGLISSDYRIAEIEALLSLPVSHNNVVAIDLHLTDAYFMIWHHLNRGRINSDTFEKIVFSAVDSGEISALEKAVEEKSIRASLELREPSGQEYALLKLTLGNLLSTHPKDSASLKKIMQLTVTMERSRWKRLIPDRYIRVNVPGFELTIVENDSVILESKIIVGKFETQTPELESVVRSFIIYPYWHVPKSIVKEILPQIQEDTIYLKRHNYDVLNSQGKPMKISTIDWLAYDAETFPYVLRQREGSENTMGVIKFIFRNNYGVYLHDTNARKLFSKNDRALSHGCIRVQKAVELARYLIKEDYIVSPEDLDQYMMLQHRMEIHLPKPIPVRLEYLTCESKDGVVIIHEDIYGKDKVVMDALRGSDTSAI